jgi:hypothetical protein
MWLSACADVASCYGSVLYRGDGLHRWGSQDLQDFLPCLPCRSPKRLAVRNTPPSRGEDIAACLGCHPSDFSGKAEKRGFAAHLHRARGGEKSKVNCLTCHTWAAKKSFGLVKQSGSWGTPSKEDYARLKKIVNSWAALPTSTVFMAGRMLPVWDATAGNCPRRIPRKTTVMKTGFRVFLSSLQSSNCDKL